VLEPSELPAGARIPLSENHFGFRGDGVGDQPPACREPVIAGVGQPGLGQTAADEDRRGWRHEVERFEITSETMLVGHSTGAGFFIKYLSTNPQLRVGKVVLVAPWLDPEGKLDTPFFTDFNIDPDLVKRTGGVTVFESDNDQPDIQKTIERLHHELKGAHYQTFHNYGHFCFQDMHTVEFPELLTELLR